MKNLRIFWAGFCKSFGLCNLPENFGFEMKSRLFCSNDLSNCQEIFYLLFLSLFAASHRLAQTPLKVFALFFLTVIRSTLFKKHLVWYKNSSKTMKNKISDSY
jgi:hypothetical protein